MIHILCILIPEVLIAVKKLNDIQLVNEAEITLIQKQSALLLQKKENGFDGELKTAGAIIENYVKGLLQKHIPNGYRICSGYIATTESIGNTENLRQHDIIIVDDRIPSLYKFGVSDIEVSAAEAVCGIVEVKRTLTKKSLSSAIKHLERTKSILDQYDNGVKSKDKSANNAVGITLSVATQAPLYAVIGLDALKEITEQEFFDSTVRPAVNNFVDLIWSPAAPFIAGYQMKSTKDDQQDLALTVSRNQKDYSPFCAIEGFDMSKSGQIYRTAISNFRTWINNSSGAPMTPMKNMKYFGIIKTAPSANY